MAKIKGKSSIKTYLVGKLVKGNTYSLKDAVAYAASTGRSEVTVRRMALELGYRAKAGVFVRSKKVRK